MTAFRPHPLAVPMLLAAALAGCTEVPELEATIPDHLEQADYPALVQLDDSLFDHPEPGEAAEDLQRGLEARSRRLQDRARRLQGTVVDDDARARMETGVRPIPSE